MSTWCYWKYQDIIKAGDHECLQNISWQSLQQSLRYFSLDQSDEPIDITVIRKTEVQIFVVEKHQYHDLQGMLLCLLCTSSHFPQL